MELSFKRKTDIDLGTGVWGGEAYIALELGTRAVYVSSSSKTMIEQEAVELIISELTMWLVEQRKEKSE